MDRSRLTTLAVGAIGLGSLAVVGAGVAAATSHGTTIHGCVAKSSGDLRIVKKAGGCTSKETALSLDKRGPRGKPGTDASPPTTFQDFGNVDAEGDLGSHNDVTSVTKQSTIIGPVYTVTFNNSIVGCSVLASAGEVAGSDPVKPGIPEIVPGTDANSVTIAFINPASQDATFSLATPFMVTATCTNVVHVG